MFFIIFFSLLIFKVIRTTVLILDNLEARHLIVPSKKKTPQTSQPKDKRDKVVEELLITERKYVHDLELLLNYQSELQTTGALSADTIHYLFPNLNVLIDFQRRFLIGIEYHAQLPPQEQRLGSVFINFEDGFDVYEGFALNQKKACQIAVAESAKLASLSQMVDPTYELPCYLIKPIQRICKYPLLLRELVKYTPADWPNAQDQIHALEVIKRVTLNVNETQRRVDNLTVVKELSERLIDWKGHNIDDFGSLLHDGVFPVIKAGQEREYHMYLFENIILCCKEAQPTKKSTMTLTSKKSKPPKRASLILKGRIYMAFITHVSSSFKAGYLLHIAWGKDASDSGFFDIKFRNDELLEQWETTINQMVARYNDPNEDPNGASVSPKSLTDSTLVNGTSYDEGSDDEFDPLQSNNSREALSEYGQEQAYPVEPSQYSFAYQQQLASISDDLNNIRLGTNLPPRMNPNLSSSSSNSSSSSINNTLTPGNKSYSSHSTGRHESMYSYTPSSSVSSNSYSVRSRSASMPTPQPQAYSNGQAPPVPPMPEDEESPAITNSNLTKIPPPTVGYMQDSPSHVSTTITNAQIPKKPSNMKVKLHYLDDTFLLIVPADVGYGALLERVERKIRLCGKQTPSPLRIKYKDEDDDFVTMHGDEDISMAMEGGVRGMEDGAKGPVPDLIIWAA